MDTTVAEFLREVTLSDVIHGMVFGIGTVFILALLVWAPLYFLRKRAAEED